MIPHETWKNEIYKGEVKAATNCVNHNFCHSSSENLFSSITPDKRGNWGDILLISP